MKIIHIVLGKANPERMNGVNRVVHQLATTQKRMGKDVEVWGITADPEKPTTKREYLLRLFQSGRQFWHIDQSFKAAVLQQTDVIFHLHGGFVPRFFMLTRFLIKVGQPYALTPHGTYTEMAMSKNKWVKKYYFKYFESKLILSAAIVQMLGHCEQSDLKKLLPEARTVLIPNGLEESALSISGEKSTVFPVFGYCGRLNQLQKGLDLLIEGFIQYKKKYKGAGKLWLIGEGEYGAEMKKNIMSSGLAKEVVFYGAQFGARKLELIAAMNAFFHTSRNEGLPMAVIEAAGMGTPCVVSTHTSMDEYIERYGAGMVLVNNTPEEIAETMNCVEMLYLKEEWKSMSANAVKMAQEVFDWKIIAEELDKAYCAA